MTKNVRCEQVVTPSAVKFINFLSPITPAFMTTVSMGPSMAARPARTEAMSATSMRMMSKMCLSVAVRVRPLPVLPDFVPTRQVDPPELGT